MGEAVGFMRECKADLRSIQHSSLAKPHLRKSAVAGRALKEEESVSELLQRYTMINDTVSCTSVHMDCSLMLKSRWHINRFLLDKIYKGLSPMGVVYYR